MDFFPGWGVNNVGHCHPKVMGAVRDQIGKLIHVPNNFYHPQQAKLAKEIIRNSFPGKVFFCNSGAEGCESAIKFARAYGQKTGRYEIITFEKSFHGRTLATLTATGQPKHQQWFHPLPVGFKTVPFNDIGAVKTAMNDKTVAIMLELIQGEGNPLVYAEWLGGEGPFDPKRAPEVEPRSAREAMRALSAAIAKGLAAACHDLSEGGLAVAAAEMAFSGEVGAVLDLDEAPKTREVRSDETVLFSESPSRFLVEVALEKEKEFLKAMKGVALARIGATIANPVLRFIGMDGSALLEEPLGALKDSWARTLPSLLDGRPKGAAGGGR